MLNYMKFIVYGMVVVLTSNTTSFAQGCFLSVSGYAEFSGTTKSFGNAALDAQLNDEYQYLVAKFGVMPNLLYLNDQGQANAYATSQVTNPMLTDGTVVIGINLIENECTQSVSGTCSAIPIIMAHEFAHILYFKRRISLSGKHKELFADYMAGVYMYYRATQFKQTFVPEAAQSFYNKGDYEFNSESHHGTPDERFGAIIAGYNLALGAAKRFKFVNLDEAIRGATGYLASMNNSVVSGSSPSNNDCIIECLSERVDKCIEVCTDDYGHPLSHCKTICQIDYRTSSGKTNRQIWTPLCKEDCK